jgi:predicted permease
MHALIEVIFPVFLVIGFGYAAVWAGFFSTESVDGLMRFTQNFAIPCLLFGAIASLDLSQGFDFALLFSFYSGATVCFLAGLFGSRLLFQRPWEDCVAIGFCYCLGILTMEIVRNRQKSVMPVVKSVLIAMFKNALFLGILVGFAVNFLKVPLPSPVTEAVDMLIQAALPAALFGMGGVLYQYRPEGDTGPILWVMAVALLLHPSLVWISGQALSLEQAGLRSAVLTSAMAPGINSYVFANMYGAARRVAASAVLFSTSASIITVWCWLYILP